MVWSETFCVGGMGFSTLSIHKITKNTENDNRNDNNNLLKYIY